MDVLSAAASGMAVASLTIQLADIIKKLHTFWVGIRDAPADIKEIATDLRLFLSILDKIRLDEQGIGVDVITERILQSCFDKASTIFKIVNDLEPGFATKSQRIRKWSVIKVSFKSDRIQKLRRSLEETKLTLLSAQQSSLA